MKVPEEQIVVVPRSALFGEQDEWSFQGLDTRSGIFHRLFSVLEKHSLIMARPDAEQDPSFKQLIPYVVVSRTRNDSVELFTYERMAGAGEVRLHGKLSIGVGGHMNQPLGVPDVQAVLTDEAVREIDEELEIPDSFGLTPELRGLINDDGNPVGRVHLGVLLEIRIPEAMKIRVRETDVLRGTWMSLDALLEAPTFGRLESWSKLALSAYVDTDGSGNSP